MSSSEIDVDTGKIPLYVVRVFGTTVQGDAFNGTGFLIDTKGSVATCWHVVKDAREIMVQLPYTKPWRYDIDTKSDERDDVVILRVMVGPGSPTYAALLHSNWQSDTAVGDAVSIWGYSAAQNLDTPQRFECTISAFGPQFGLLWINGDVNPGDSGGPVMNSRGEVVGITRYKDESRSGQAMATPISVLVKLMENKREAAGIPIRAQLVHHETIPDSIQDRSPGTSDRRLPGSLPPIWNVSLRQNRNFLGRETILRDLHVASLPRQHGVIIQAITGLGGVGKTQVALEHIYCHLAQYDLVWWFRAEQAETLASDYVRLAQHLGPSLTDASNQPAIVEDVRRWLGQQEKWLLVFDSATELQTLQQYLPQAGHGHIIITSRNPDWDDVASCLHLPVWESMEAVNYLLQRTGDKSDVAARRLAEELGNLPLALAHAAAYIKETSITADVYLDSFRKQRQQFITLDSSADYNETVATTWKLSFNAVQQQVPVAAELLNLFAFFAPDHIPRDLLRRWEKTTDEFVYRKAVKALRQYSLIEATPDTLSVNRLVQTVARERLPEEERRAYAGVAVGLIKDAFHFDGADADTLANCALLLSHGLTSADHAETLHADSKSTALLFNLLGGYLKEIAEFAKAISALRRALAITEASYGSDHPYLATDLTHLGLVLKDMGNLAEAKVLFERAKEIDTKQPGSNASALIRDLNNIGWILKESGDLSGAEEQFETAIKVAETFYGKHHTGVVECLIAYGFVLKDLHDYAGAQSQFERARQIDRDTYGAAHPSVALDLNNIGLVLKDMGNLKEAKVLFQSAREIDEKHYTKPHATVACDLNNLGFVYKDMEDFGSAKQAFETALGITENLYGRDDLRVARDASKLGLVLKDMKDWEGASAQFERAKQIDEQKYGPGHPAVALDINNLGLVLKDQEDYEGAKEKFVEALQIYAQAYPNGNPQAASTMRNLGYVLRDLGKTEAAEVQFQRALTISPQPPELVKERPSKA